MFDGSYQKNQWELYAAQVVWNKMMEQHQILAVMIQLVLYKAIYHCSWQAKLSEMVW
jgi:hypothetical protein